MISLQPAPSSARRRRRGSALLITVVTVAVFAGLCQSVMMAVVRQHQRIDRDQRQAQAEWLVESAVLRSIENLRRDPNWTGEIWRPSLAGQPVQVAVERLPTTSERHPDQITIRATATLSENTGQRTAVRSCTLPLPASAPEELR